MVPAGEEPEDPQLADEEESDKFPFKLYVLIGAALLLLLLIVILVVVLLIPSRAKERGEVASSLPSSTGPTTSTEMTSSASVPTEQKEGSKIEVSDNDRVQPSGILVIQKN